MTLFASLNCRFPPTSVPDLFGKVAIVTGANSGLGYATTVALAAHGSQDFLACRNQSRTQEAIDRAKEEIKSKHLNIPSPQFEFLELDLGDINKAQQAALEFLKKGLSLHILVNNSGIIGGFLELSPDGIESEFTVNHMGHFVFTMTRSKILNPHVRDNEHIPARKRPWDQLRHNLQNQRRFTASPPIRLGPILPFETRQHHVRKGPHLSSGNESRVFVNYSNPGYVTTKGTRSINGGDVLGGLKEWTHGLVTYPVERGALTPLYLTSSPEVENKKITGQYFRPIANELEPSAYARDEKLQEELWAYCEKLANEKLKT
ncbi:hypothetical protein BGZ47_004926 [Haplosporangium gracile]|nr:hypothetical protein BGZ47_004926 [Haplosporangium gracile]